MPTAVVIQPSYVPWRGYFDLISRADVFVFYDDVQYDRGGWRNRNRIKTPRGTEWLTIPVHIRGHIAENRPINSIEIDSGKPWIAAHRAKLAQSYRRAPFFAESGPLLDTIYASPAVLLADFTVASTVAIAQWIGIARTRFLRSSAMPLEGRKTDRLVALLKAVGATHYLSGPSAKAYIEAEKFERAAIALEYAAYDYPEYDQLYPPYDGAVSILDTLFMLGRDALASSFGKGTAGKTAV
jgi:hypothetical protein